MKRLAYVCFAALVALFLTLLLSDCAGPGYYSQAIAGHLALMRDRQEIVDILGADDTDPELARALELALELREFASSRLGLPDDGSYRQFVRTGRSAVTWNVVATPELSLDPRRWCFPVAGCVPYRGYFQHEAALRFAEGLAADGLDVSVSPALAYSTLGWFADPLLDTMLRYRDEQLAAVIFHELAHQRLYLPGDTAFNESYASFVEDVGVELWLRSTEDGQRMAEWERHRLATAQFDELLLEARTDLEALYASPASPEQKRQSKAVILGNLQKSYRKRVEEEWQGRDLFSGWFSEEINNAKLALFTSYRGGVCAFASLYEAAGEDLQRFHELATAKSELSDEDRRAWLEQACPAVASQPEL